jgi:hypothetical protein
MIILTAIVVEEEAGVSVAPGALARRFAAAAAGSPPLPTSLALAACAPVPERRAVRFLGPPFFFSAMIYLKSGVERG